MPAQRSSILRANADRSGGDGGRPAGRGRDFARRLRREGLVESCGRGIWSVSQAGCAFGAATAAKRLTRATVERALVELMERVALVNERPYFLGKVVRVVLFGSMLDPGADRPGDIDLAIEIAPNETNEGRLQEQNNERAEVLAARGHRFRNVMEVADCWRQEVFRFRKAGSRSISLADYKVEKALVLTVPHRILTGDGEPPPTPERTPDPEPGPQSDAASGWMTACSEHVIKVRWAPADGRPRRS